MICIICGTDFEQRHFNQKYCCEDCKKQAIKNTKEKYKKSPKGIEAQKRWVNSERRKENEKRYRQNPVAKHKAVLRTKKYLETHEHAREAKRERDRAYGKTEHGRELNKKATSKYSKSEKR